ncbi:MAG: hypothetical protein ACM3S1_04050 [Hyphomicrobiales bacterium]
MKELTFTITRIAPEADSLHVTVEWAVADAEDRRIVLLVDTLALPLDAGKSEIEAAIAARAKAYVRPRYLEPRPAPRAEHLALLGAERLVSEVETKEVGAVEIGP